MVGAGDVLTFQKANDIRIVKIRALGTRRGPASEAELLYEDMSPQPAERGAGEGGEPLNPSREKGAGRPTKSDRRALDRLRGDV